MLLEKGTNVTVAGTRTSLSGTIVDSQGNNIRVALGDGRRIWVPAEKLTRIEEPPLEEASPKDAHPSASTSWHDADRWLFPVSGLLGAVGTVTLMFTGLGYQLPSQRPLPPLPERVVSAAGELGQASMDKTGPAPSVDSDTRSVTAEELLDLEAKVARLEQRLDRETASIRYEQFEEQTKVHTEAALRRSEQTKAELRLIAEVNKSRAERYQLEWEEKRRKTEEARAEAEQERAQIRCLNVTVPGVNGSSQLQRECVDLGPPKPIPSARFTGRR